MSEKPLLYSDDDIETMRILFNAEINALCNQNRHCDAKELEGIRDRLLAGLRVDSVDCVDRLVDIQNAIDNLTSVKQMGVRQKGFNDFLSDDPSLLNKIGVDEIERLEKK